MVTGIVIPADADQPIELRDFAGLDDYRAAVDGWIEAIDLLDLGITIYVNEEGLLRHLPFNSRASFLWWYHVPTARQLAVLVGDAVVTGLPNRNGVDTDLPASANALLLSTSRFRVEVRVHGDLDWHTHSVVYPDYWEAMVWAMLLLERVTDAVDSRVVPVEHDE